MKPMSEQELKDILDKHGKWLRNEENGSRADLPGANLSGANLYCADLSRADLSRANLSGANLYCANLSGANLYCADLSRADLYCANLSRANLPGANLSGADLYCANLSGADLKETLLANKIMVNFQFGQHIALYMGSDEIVIGCHRYPINHWIENYEKIGKDNNYTDKQIKRYGQFIRSCQRDFNKTKGEE